MLPYNDIRQKDQQATMANEWRAYTLHSNARFDSLYQNKIALPRELTYEQNWALAKAFVQKEFVDNGMVADLNFHTGHKGQEEQPHIHVMLTLREVTKDGFGQKVRAWNDKALLKDWREA